MSYKYRSLWSDLFKEEVVILSEYEDTDGRALLRGHVAGTPADDYVIFRLCELRNQKGGAIIEEN